MSELKPLTTDELEIIRERCKRATSGPWRWFGYLGVNSIYLATVGHGRQFVMDFARWGMRLAAPRFQVRITGGGIMRRVDEPGIVKAKEYGENEIIEVLHPDMDFIQHSAEDISRLIATIDTPCPRCVELDALKARMGDEEGMDRVIEKALHEVSYSEGGVECSTYRHIAKAIRAYLEGP